MTVDAKVGEVRPSQLLFTYGVGAIIDLPKISVIVTGLEDWPVNPDYMREVHEERLLRAVQSEYPSVARLLSPPILPDESRVASPFDEAALVGVPVATFPRWMVCPACRRLAPLSSGLFKLKTDRYFPDRTTYQHINCSVARRPPDVVPARFLVACEDGHLDDFPWNYFVHAGQPCSGTPLFKLLDFGPSGEARYLQVSCETCGRSRRLAEAFGNDNLENLPRCMGRRPHLRDYDDEECPHIARAISLGASNMWFPNVLSAVAIPAGDSALEGFVRAKWNLLKKATNRDIVTFLRTTEQLGADLTAETDEDIWNTVQELQRRGLDSATEPSDVPDLKAPEWRVFSACDESRNTADFRLRAASLPADWRFPEIEQVVIVERLREARALIGFTRLDAGAELTDPEPGIKIKNAPLARQKPEWAPTGEVRGEGLFVRFSEEHIRDWERQDAVQRRARQFYQGHTKWRALRNISDPAGGFPGLRYVLLHSFAHILMRALALEAGYALASLRERIYSRSAEEESGPMAGVLIYTAATDSEGTLGGLASLGKPDVLQQHIQKALYVAKLCAGDPLCANHKPEHDERSIHAAACHNCLFAPETSCERGNKYLDRSVLVPTIEDNDLAFFVSGVSS